MDYGALQTVVRAAVANKLQHASCAWWGFATEADRQRINNHCFKPEYQINNACSPYWFTLNGLILEHTLIMLFKLSVHKSHTSHKDFVRLFVCLFAVLRHTSASRAISAKTSLNIE